MCLACECWGNPAFSFCPNASFAVNTEAEDYFVSILWPFREPPNLLCYIISKILIAAIFPLFGLRKQITILLSYRTMNYCYIRLLKARTFLTHTVIRSIFWHEPQTQHANMFNITIYFSFSVLSKGIVNAIKEKIPSLHGLNNASIWKTLHFLSVNYSFKTLAKT